MKSKPKKVIKNLIFEFKLMKSKKKKNRSQSNKIEIKKTKKK